MKKVFSPTPVLTGPLHYCPGCTHGIIHRLIAEVVDEMGVQKNTIGVGPVGCAVFIWKYFDHDYFQAPHGRAMAVATGVRRANQDAVIYAYQGDGDFLAIGCAESIHAAARNENFTAIFVNNQIYGMTGGQMAPTTLFGQKATTCKYGRDPQLHGHPIKACEMFATLPGPAFITRTSVHDVKHVLETKKAIQKAFRIQQQKKGFSLIEIMSICPTNHHQTVFEQLDFCKNEAIKHYPLGVFKDCEA